MDPEELSKFFPSRSVRKCVTCRTTSCCMSYTVQHRTEHQDQEGLSPLSWSPPQGAQAWGVPPPSPLHNLWGTSTEKVGKRTLLSSCEYYTIGACSHPGHMSGSCSSTLDGVAFSLCGGLAQGTITEGKAVNTTLSAAFHPLFLQTPSRTPMCPSLTFVLTLWACLPTLSWW